MVAETPDDEVGEPKLFAVLADWIYRKGPGPPNELFHYTDAKGLLGIIQEKSIWASSIYYLNDASELRYGSELLIEILNSHFHEISSRIAEAVFSSLQSMAVNRDEHPCSIFVTCFCQDGNLLSQWRNYGRDAGYAIGFELRGPKGQLSLATASSELVVTLVPVEYDLARQKERLTSFLKEILRVLAEREADQRLEPVAAGNLFVFKMSLWEAILTELLSFKESRFKEEKEWRLIVREERIDRMTRSLYSPPPPQDWKPSFRPSPLGIVPYVSVRSAGPDGLLPITSVSYGPFVLEEVAEASLKDVLMHNGYSKNVDIRGCGIPLRRVK